MPDTSCMVAAVSSWHEHHKRAINEIQSRLKKKQRMIIAGHSLVEAYSVLTRLPAPHRISAQDANAVLQSNFIKNGITIALDASAYQSLLHSASAQGISGGQVYDALIAASARQAKAETLVTLNKSHFESIAGDLEIVVPA
jgi:predicted nucleic acid-binding protein